MLCTIKFIFWFAFFSIGILRSKKAPIKDDWLSISMPYKSKENLDLKNCEFIKVFVRKTEEVNDKTNLRKLTIVNQKSEKIAILDLNSNDFLNHTNSCQNDSNKYWSICMQSHEKQINLNLTQQIINYQQMNTTEQSQKSVKWIKENSNIKKMNRRLAKRSNLKYLKVNSSKLINDNLIQSTNLTESQFILINCDFSKFDSSNCKMIKLIKKGCN